MDDSRGVIAAAAATAAVTAAAAAAAIKINYLSIETT